MKANGRCAFVERAGVGPDDSLPKVGNLQLLVLQVVLDKLGHRPVEKHSLGLGIVAQALFNLLPCRRFTYPDIAVTGRTQSIPQTLDNGAHGAETIEILRRKA